MHYQELEPGPALRGRVRYWRLTGERAAASSGGSADFEPVLPDGCVEVIVHLGDPFRVERDGRVELQPRALLAGPGTTPVRLAPTGRVDVIGAHLEAGLAAELLDVPPAELVDRLPELGAVAPELARGLRDELADPRAGDDWRAVLERRIASALDGSARPPRRVIEAAVARVRASGGRVSVAELAHEAGLSTRQLERRFRERVGLGPKTFVRIVRFQRALALLRAPRARLAQVALRCGYYDQAHLVRDFRQFAEASPRRYVAGGHELAGHFVDAEP